MGAVPGLPALRLSGGVSPLWAYALPPTVRPMAATRKAGFLLEMTKEQRDELHATAAAAGMTTRAYVLERLGIAPPERQRPGRKVRRQDALIPEEWPMAG